MARLGELMAGVQAVRDALHDRLDDNISDRAFNSLRVRHAQAVVQARRETADPSLKAESARYDPVITELTTAAATVASAVETEEKAMLDASFAAGKALDKVERLP